MTTLASGSLAQMLAVAGVPHEVGGNTPFLLEGATRVWFVQSGSVEIFVVRVDDGVPHGMRHHFLSAAPGDLLFGMALETAEGLGLLAVAAVGTVVVEIPLAKVQSLAVEPASAHAVVDAVDRWVVAISGGVSQYIYPKPRADVLVEPGSSVSIGAGQRVRARKGVAWMRHREGGSLFIGMEALDPGDPPPFVPVCHDTWVESLGPAEIDVVDTASAIADESIWAGLEAFYALVFRCQSYNTTLAAVDEYNRLAKKAERERQVRHESLEELVRVIGDATPMSDAGETQHDDPLFMACAAIGDVLGVRFEPPPKSSTVNSVV